MEVESLGDAELMDRSRALSVKARHADLALVIYLGEIEERRLHLREGYSSIFDLCVRGFGLSEGAAFRRMHAARLVRRFPVLREHIETGALHLSGLVMLREHLEESNVDEIVARATGKTKREIEELVARIAPRPDVPGRLRKLPVHAEPSEAFVRPPEPSSMKPLAEARYKLQLTASAELRDKIERARALLRHRNPNGELAVVIEYAVDALLKQLGRERWAETERPQRMKSEARTESAHVPNAVRRAVFERDGERCTFTSPDGRRCESREFLEIDHIESRARGGPPTVENLRVLCRAHNRLAAEDAFGRSHVEEQIHLRQRKSSAARGEAASEEGTSEETRPDGDFLQRKSSPNVNHAEGALAAEAIRGLIYLGFRESEARRAVETIESDSESEPPSVRTMVREAIKLLT